ncbi:Xaa-Pro dipeptidase [Halomonas urumqiensis]|uniref:Xaa-Pro dipeptidase n=1 Tax=Halomonas urumqiensis TaxID=1684789 RepID=UPI001E54C823|nr:Xaa-Pro dipeptidase [Halomonas urumqiensis]
MSLDVLQHEHLVALEERYSHVLVNHQLDGVLLYSGHPARHFGDDQHASFVTQGHFMHWTGLAHAAHCWLLIRPGLRPTLYFHAPDDIWHLPNTLPDEPWVNHFHVERRQEVTPPALPPGRFAVVGDVAPTMTAQWDVKINPDGLTRDLDALRVHKSAYEVACLREANQRAMLGHQAARDAFLGGACELDIQFAYLAATRQRETSLPYGNIIALNAHGGVLHYQHQAIRPEAIRRSLLVDAGYRYRGYCADITRTWPGPHANQRFAPLVEGVTALQRTLIAALAPGVSFIDLHERMHAGLADLLIEQRLVRTSAEAAVASGITRAFCPHGLGHLLGVQVHDVAGHRDEGGNLLSPPVGAPFLRLTRELQAGMVVTIEPGIYIIPMLLDAYRGNREIDWDAVGSLADHGGIRIEDNIHVTLHGPDNLTPRHE